MRELVLLLRMDVKGKEVSYSSDITGHFHALQLLVNYSFLLHVPITQLAHSSPSPPTAQKHPSS